MMQVSIRSVTYSGADAKDKKLFAFLSTDMRTKVIKCHVFKTKAGVRAVRHAHAVSAPRRRRKWWM